VKGKPKIKWGIWLKNGAFFDTRTAVNIGIAAEQAGWDGVFVSDSFNPFDSYSDPWSVLSAIAVQTEHIVLGTWLTPVPSQQPWRLARATATLDQISNGRLILGVGLGTPDEYKSYLGAYKPKVLGRKYDEALEIITRLWTGEEVYFTGEFFNIDGGKLSVIPVQEPRIPIVMGCWWPHKKPFRRAAKWDGIMPAWPAMYPDMTGPQGEKATDTYDGELRALVNYYKKITGDKPGEIILPMGKKDSNLALYTELGATWLIHCEMESIEDVYQGPPLV
jgi:alkanesulfonate monooxygenase SsuD/methylene tetrahydromethanopterin reductase-like flavin-dependent oxidoreductase (luciferase family)